MRSGLLARIKWSVCILKSHRSLCESFSRTGAGLCIYHLFVWSNWNFLHIPSGSPCRPSHVSPYIPSVLICCIIIIIIIIIIIYTPCEFFMQVLAEGLSVQSEWKQVSLSLQDSTQYSGRSSQCRSLDTLYSSSDSQLFQHLSQPRSKRYNYIFLSTSPSCSTAFYVLKQGPSTRLSFRFLWFSFCCSLGRHSPLYGKFSLSLSLSLSLFFFFFFC